MLLLATAFIGNQPINNEHYIQEINKPTEIHSNPEYNELTELVKERIKPIEASTLKEIAKVKQVPNPKPKPVQTASTNVRQASTSKSTAPSGWFSYGWCTYYISTRRAVGQWNDASQWYWQAQRDGWSTGLTPRVGAIGVQKGGNHVVYVEAVKGGNVYVSEMNFKGFGVISSRTVPASSFRYIY